MGTLVTLHKVQASLLILLRSHLDPITGLFIQCHFAENESQF